MRELNTALTVRQLIQELERCPDDLLVVFGDWEEGLTKPVSKVQVEDQFEADGKQVALESEY